MSQRSHLRKLLVLSVSGLLASGLGVGIGLATATGHPGAGGSARAASPGPLFVASMPVVVSTGARMTLTGDGMGSAVFGQPAAVVMDEVDPLLGAPSARNGIPDDCTVDAVVQWGPVNAFFDQGSFVGYDVGSFQSLSGELVTANAATSSGLRVGDTLGQAEQLYPSLHSAAYAQGGSWSVKTSTGPMAGLLLGSGGPATATAQVDDISAGAGGCPP